MMDAVELSEEEHPEGMQPEEEAEKEAELTDQRYSSKDVLKAMKDAIGGERVV